MQNLFRVLFLLMISLIGVHAQEKVLSPDDIRKLVPGPIEGFKEEGEVKGKLIQIGDLKYSLCERRFLKGRQLIRILLFDYTDAPIMYSQATRDWKNFLPAISDSSTLRPVRMELCTGWESYNKRNNLSQIYLGICDRYFLNLTGEGVELETLNSVLDQFHFDQFPK